MDTTLLGALLGFMAAVLPAVFNALSDYFRHQHDMELTAQKIDAQVKGVTVVGPGPVVTYTAGFGESPEDIQVATDAASVEPAPQETEKPEGLRGRLKKIVTVTRRPPADTAYDDEADLDAGRGKVMFVRLFATMRAAVRPLITYGFFLLFVYVKVKGMYHGLYVDHTPALLLLPVLWDEGTHSLLAAVLAFWFGSRAIERQAEAKIAAKASAGDNP